MSDLHEAALKYADLGYRVFPCAPGSKLPRTEHGFKDASTDLDQVDYWWTFHPSANIGIDTSPLILIDVDGRENAWLAGEPERASDLAAGAVAVTPRGGKHYYFRRPEGLDVRCSASKLAPRVDVRSIGGYALLPPSANEQGAYRWVPGLELDRPLDGLPYPPAWLVELLAQPAPSAPSLAHVGPVAAEANEIPSGQRNATLARLAGTMRRVGMSPAEIGAALAQVNADRCRPPLDSAEVQRIAASVARYEPSQIATAVAEDHFGQLALDRPFAFQALTSAELDDGNFALEYLIDGILVKGQPGVIAGPKKCLKTNLSVDLTVSLATGEPFLGRFPVSRPVRVGLMSGESGPATMQETARRVASSKGWSIRTCQNARWSFDVPQLDNFLHIQALRSLVEEHQLEVLILDPTYLMLTSLGDNAGNLFAVGALLKVIGDLAHQTGCTPILCHHLKKSVSDPYEPAELENIAWAGFQEFVRQWLLLNRRVRYDPDRGGHHELWLSVGGSAGHSGLWGLNIDEGTRQSAGGRYWDVALLSASDAFDERHAASAQAHQSRKQREQQVRVDQSRQAILDALAQFPEGETSRVLRDVAGVSSSVLRRQLEQLLEEEIVITCEVKKHTRTEPAYRLLGVGGEVGHGGKPPFPPAR
jgi:hypothetical protein